MTSSHHGVVLMFNTIKNWLFFDVQGLFRSISAKSRYECHVLVFNPHLVLMVWMYCARLVTTLKLFVLCGQCLFPINIKQKKKFKFHSKFFIILTTNVIRITQRMIFFTLKTCTARWVKNHIVQKLWPLKQYQEIQYFSLLCYLFLKLWKVLTKDNPLSFF